MKIFTGLIALIFTFFTGKGQNLVLNGSFEQYIGCPNYISQIDSATYWQKPNIATTDYYNQCAAGTWAGVPTNYAGYQYPVSGNAYAGIIPFSSGLLNYREYLEGILDTTLTSGTCYHFEMYMNLANIVRYKTSDIGVYFSDTLITGIPNYKVLPLVPHVTNVSGNYPDTLNWTIVSGNFIASGNENYLIIGNFKVDSLTDTIYCNPQALINDSYVYIDDVSLTVCTGIEHHSANTKINIYPNPFSDIINITIYESGIAEINLYDVTKRRIFTQSFTSSTSINTLQYAKGIYFYEVRNKNELIKKGKIVKN